MNIKASTDRCTTATLSIGENVALRKKISSFFCFVLEADVARREKRWKREKLLLPFSSTSSFSVTTSRDKYADVSTAQRQVIYSIQFLMPFIRLAPHHLPSSELERQAEEINLIDKLVNSNACESVWYVQRTCGLSRVRFWILIKTQASEKTVDANLCLHNNHKGID